MIHTAARVVALLLAGASLAGAQPSPPATSIVPAAPPAVQDCSRWPASVYDLGTQSCVCPANMWWNLRGDACLPREHAAAEFCTTVWPSSSPYFTSNGGYRCVCAPPLMWNEQATACRPPAASMEMDCSSEWPGTLPVLSPSGTEYECRCPGGRRWDEASRSCVAGAPVVAMGRGFYGDDPLAPPPGPREAGPQPAVPQEPVPYGAPRGAAPPPSRPLPGSGTGASAECQPLLNEIRMRAEAGQTAEADALGMQAAVAGCDPAAIAEAASAKKR